MPEFVDSSALSSKLVPSSPNLLTEFCETISQLISEHPSNKIAPKISEYLPPLLSMPNLLSSEQRLLSGEDYEKYEIFLCPNDDFSVLAIVWPAGIYSPIHDHQTWCAFGVLEGVMQENHYQAVDNEEDCHKADLIDSIRHPQGSVTFMCSEKNIHCMHNPGSSPAISIHVYGGNSTKLGANVDKIYNT